MLCLQETHSTEDDEQVWTNEWGGYVWFSHGSSTSRGVAILIKRDCAIDSQIMSRGEDGRMLICRLMSDGVEANVCNIYAPNIDSPGFFNNCFERMKELHNNIIIGDFNLVLNPILDRNSSMNNNKNAAAQISECMEEFLMEDAWRIRNENVRRYSWYRSTSAKIQASRLDFAIISSEILDQVHDTFYMNGVASDHSAFFIRFEFVKNDRGAGFWKFNTLLLTEQSYVDFMNELLDNMLIKYQHLRPSGGNI